MCGVVRIEDDAGPKWIATAETEVTAGEFLRQTKAWLRQHPESRGIVTLNSWNEWAEGNYVEPDTVHGMKYLEAIQQVFPPMRDAELAKPPAAALDTAPHNAAK